VVITDRNADYFVDLQWVLPELVGHVFATMLMLVTWHWFLFLLNIPMTLWLLYRSAAYSAGSIER
jgi:protein cornichon